MARSARDDAKVPLWHQRFLDQKQSGLSIRAWCQCHGIPEKRFFTWRRNLLGSYRPRPSAPIPPSARPRSPGTPKLQPIRPAPAFVPLTVIPDFTAEILLPSGLAGRLRANTSLDRTSGVSLKSELIRSPRQIHRGCAYHTFRPAG